MFGNGSTNDSSTPIKVADNVLTVDGTLYLAGNNNYGQLGTGDTLQQLSFVKVMENCKAVSCGLQHTAVVTDSGELYTFGANNCGQFGSGDACNVLPLPYPSRVMDNVASVFCGDEHTVVITENGDAYGFGSNEYCQISAENASGYAVSPQQIALCVIAASAGMAHSAFALANGNLLMCGKTQRVNWATCIKRHIIVRLKAFMQAQSPKTVKDKCLLANLTSKSMRYLPKTSPMLMIWQRT